MTKRELIDALSDFNDTDEVQVIVPSAGYKEKGFVSTHMVGVCYVSSWEGADNTVLGPVIQPATTEDLENLRQKGVWTKKRGSK